MPSIDWKEGLIDADIIQIYRHEIVQDDLKKKSVMDILSANLKNNYDFHSWLFPRQNNRTRFHFFLLEQYTHMFWLGHIFRSNMKGGSIWDEWIT